MTALPPIVDGDALDRLRNSAASGTANVAAMYSSVLGGVVTDPAHMTVPIDDHLLHRGHGVFDTASVHNGRLYRLGMHLDRFLASATSARIEHEWSRSELEQLIAGTVARSGLRDGSVRYWMGAGPGGFSFAPEECTGASFYCVMSKPPSFVTDAASGPEAIAEVSVSHDFMKSPKLAAVKSNNYLLNVLTHLDARDRDGRFGVLIDRDGNIAEGAVVNVGFVTADGVLKTPPFDVILRGTSIRRVMLFARDLLVPEGLLTGVEQAAINASTVRNDLAEMFVVGGDTHLFAVTAWDGQPVGDGAVGPVTHRLFTLLEAEARGAQVHGTSAQEWTDIPYPAAD